MSKKLKEFCQKLNNLATQSWRWLLKNGKKACCTLFFATLEINVEMSNIRFCFRAELMKDIDAHYYGFRDDDDGALVPLEMEAEKKAVAKALQDWKTKRASGAKADDADDDDVNIYKVPESSEQDEVEEAMRAGKEARFVSHVPIPSQKDIQDALLRRKKQELLREYSLDNDDDQVDEKK